MLSPPFLLFDCSLSLIFYTPLCCISTRLTKFLNPFPTFIVRKDDIQKIHKSPYYFIFLQRINQLNCRNRPYYAEIDTNTKWNNQDCQIRTRFSPFLFYFFKKGDILGLFPFQPLRIKEYDIDMKIQDLNISADSKSALKSIGLTMVSELAGQNYITLINKFPKNYNIEPLIDELNALGYLLPPSDEISIYNVPMSKRLQNALTRNGVMYLSQLSSYSKEDILHFRNLGEKTILELEQICQEYNIEIRSMLSIKEYFSKYQFSSKIYPLLFRNNISCIDDFKHMTANDLYLICQKDYSLTMQTYFILKENGLVLNDWQDKFIFEILPGKNAAYLWKKHKISMLSQIPDCNECTLKEIVSSSNSYTAAIKELLSFG